MTEPAKTNQIPLNKNILRNNQFLLLLFLPAFVFIHNLNEFRDLIFRRDIFFLLLAWLVLPFLIFFLLKKITRLDKQQSILLTLYLTGCFFFFGVLQDFLHKHITIRFFSKSYFIIPLFLSIPIIVYRYFRKTRNSIIISYLNKLFPLLILYEVIIFVNIYFNYAFYSAISKTFKYEHINKTKENAIKLKPDIYHFVFDSYTNSTTLKKHWNYINPIDTFLANRGFYVTTNSISNYDFTPFSLASLFNLHYLPNSQKYLGRNAKNFYIGRLAFQDNELFKFLQANGYTLNNFSLVDTIEYMNRMGTLGPQNPVAWLRNQTFERFYLNPWIKHKLFQKFYDGGIPPDLLKNYKAYIDYNQKALHHLLSSIYRSTNSLNPNFTFVHFMIPHEPYVFDEHGRIDLTVAPKSDNMNSYLMQIKYVNTIIQQIIGLLLKDRKEKIIIIQGDHGYRNYISGDIPREAQFETFNAVYFYDLNYKDLYNEISLVNTYRIVLSNYFHYDLPLLKDSIFLNQH